MHSKPEAPAGEASSGIFSGYAAPKGHFCEAFEAQGRPRPHWAAVVASIENMGMTQFARRLGQAGRILQEHGATHNLFGDPEELDRPWDLDIIPCSVTGREWSLLESGLAQRARLFRALFNDVYGEQRMLRKGYLPPELFFANPAFMLPGLSIGPQAENIPFLFTMDLVRTVSGEWRAAGCRTGTPVGPGYALENRIVVSQVMSRVFHQNRVKRLAPFFMRLNEMFKEAALFNRDDPSIALVSPGPGSSTYFEHAFLSRYLGYPMVESADLTIRDNKVFMKTLGGLTPVDVIFRFMADGDSDPLSLRSSPSCGITGLVHAVRTRNVAVINPLGAGIMESPAFSAYWPVLCRELLGEDLLLDELKAAWCGNAKAAQAVLANPERFVLRHAFDSRQPAFDGAENPGALAGALRASPAQYAAVEKAALSTAPSVVGSRVGSKFIIAKFFVAANGSVQAVMPGGLARASADESALLSTGGDDAASKDIWVFSDQPVEMVSLLSRLETPLEIRRGGDLPSRVADNLLWLGRYIERAENQIRILRAIFKRLSGEAPFLEMPELSVLLALAADGGFIDPGLAGARSKADFLDLQNAMLEAVFGKARPASLVNTINQVNRTAKNVRDRLSMDSWRTLMRLEAIPQQSGAGQWALVSDTYELLNDALITLSAFSGLAMESMTRGLGWRFMDMGRRIDRAGHVARLVQSSLADFAPELVAVLEALLEILDSSMTYRSRYRTALQFAPVIDLLMADELNPRSLAFQLAALCEHVEHLPRNSVRRFATPEEKTVLNAVTLIRLSDIDAICAPDAEGNRASLENLLEEVQKCVHEFSNHVTQHYLSRIPTTQHFTALGHQGKK